MARRARIPTLAWIFALAVGLALFAAGLRLRQDEPQLRALDAAGEALEADDPVERLETRSNAPESSTAAPAPDAARSAARDLPVAPAGAVKADLDAIAVTGTVALILDDVGRKVSTIDRFLDLGVPISFAVLPFETRTSEVARRVREAGAELLVHLPMEGAAGANPGPGALLSGMSVRDVRRRTEQALAAVPNAVGVNNHMGSVLSADPELMGAVLQVVAEKQLFFVDSRTSAASVGYRAARELDLAAAERDVFLDSLREIRAIELQFEQLLERAAAEGSAIAIGHPYDETLDVLERLVPKAVAAGYRFVPVSYLVERSPPPQG